MHPLPESLFIIDAAAWMQNIEWQQRYAQICWFLCPSLSLSLSPSLHETNEEDERDSRRWRRKKTISRSSSIEDSPVDAVDEVGWQRGEENHLGMNITFASKPFTYQERNIVLDCQTSITLCSLTSGGELVTVETLSTEWANNRCSPVWQKWHLRSQPAIGPVKTNSVNK